MVSIHGPKGYGRFRCATLLLFIMYFISEQRANFVV